MKKEEMLKIGKVQRWLRTTRLKNRLCYSTWDKKYLYKVPVLWRPHVASIVWWDFVAENSTKRESRKFESLLKQVNQNFLSPEDLAKGLELVGYPPEIAQLRAGVK